MENLRAIDIAAIKKLGFLPDEYVSWLYQHGWGEIGQARYMLYSASIPLTEFNADAPSHLWAFGDDFSGVSGCSSSNGDATVYEWDSSVSQALPTHKRFQEFLATYDPAL